MNRYMGKRLVIASIKLLVLCLTTVIISGCGTKKIDLSEQNKANIPEFSLSRKVAIANAPTYHGTENAVGGAIGGVIGALAASTVTQSEPAKITKYLDDQKIDIKTIVKAEFEHQLRETPRFSGKLKEDAKAQIQLYIYIYGLIVNPLGANYKPWLAVTATFIDASGSVVWEQSEWVANANDTTPGYSYDDYFKSPDAFKAAFSVAAKEVVKLLIEEMD